MEPASAEETISKAIAWWSKAIAWWKSLKQEHRTSLKIIALIGAVFLLDYTVAILVFTIGVAMLCFMDGFSQPPIQAVTTSDNERLIARLFSRYPVIFKALFWGIIVWLVGIFRSMILDTGLPNPRDPGVEWLCYPFLIYAVVIASAMAFRYCVMKRNKAGSPSNPETSNLAGHGQFANDFNFSLFMLAFLGSVASLSFTPNSCAVWLAQWLTASARDANLPVVRDFTVSTFEIYPGNNLHVIPPPYDAFEMIVRLVFFGILLMLLALPAIRLSAFFTTFIRRLPQKFAPVAIAEAILISARLPCSRLTIREGAAWFKNIARTFWWLLFCYAALFWLIGMSSGPLGQAIANWIEFSIRDATSNHLPLTTGEFNSLRLFLGSIFALYGTVPVAVTALAALPMGKPRQAVVNEEGILFPRGPFLSMLGRPYRLWSDVTELRVRGKFNIAKLDKTKLRLSFFSGGHVDLRPNYMSDADFEQFMGSIDEHAAYCHVTDDALLLRKGIRERMGFHAVLQNQFRSGSACDFRSTIFQPLKVGDKLPGGRGRIVRLLSSKPLAAVYMCRLSSHKLAIVKQFYLADDNTETARLRKTFTREYELLSRLSHPALSKVLETFVDGESTFLTLEYSSGTDLRKLVAELGPRPEALVRSWAEQLCQVVSYLHAQDPAVLHRDITPDNIIIDNDGRLRLIDFGAAHQFLEGITGTMIGKQSYVSPEQLRGNASPRSDIYSIGCTLYFLLTGKDPIPLARCQFPEDAKVSRQLKELIELSTEFDEEDRPEGVFEFLQRLQVEELPQSVVQKLLDSKEYFELDAGDAAGVAAGIGPGTGSATISGVAPQTAVNAEASAPLEAAEVPGGPPLEATVSQETAAAPHEASGKEDEQPIIVKTPDREKQTA